MVSTNEVVATPGIRINKRRVPSAFTASKFEVKPLLVVPRLIGRLETNGGGHDVERAVPHDEPLILRLRQHDEAAALPPLVAMELTARAPQRRHAGSGPRNAGIGKGGLERRNTAVTSIARESFTSDNLFEVAG